jgi:outer membrane murein-binding lipoprotein Lpp
MILTILLLIGAVCVLGALLVGERSQRLEAESRADKLASSVSDVESAYRKLDIENSKLVARNSHLAGKLAKLQEALNEDQ